MIDVPLIRQQINEMRSEVLNGNLDTEYLKEKYNYLFLNTPSIWYMIKDNETDYMGLLEILLGKAENFHAVPEDQKESALEKEHHDVNELLAEKYVYPVVGRKPDEE